MREICPHRYRVALGVFQFGMVELNLRMRRGAEEPGASGCGAAVALAHQVEFAAVGVELDEDAWGHDFTFRMSQNLQSDPRGRGSAIAICEASQRHSTTRTVP